MSDSAAKAHLYTLLHDLKVVYCDLHRFTEKAAAPGGARDYEYRDHAENYVEEYEEDEFEIYSQ